VAEAWLSSLGYAKHGDWPKSGPKMLRSLWAIPDCISIGKIKMVAGIMPITIYIRDLEYPDRLRKDRGSLILLKIFPSFLFFQTDLPLFLSQQTVRPKKCLVQVL